MEQAGGSRGHPPTSLGGLSEVGLASPSVAGFAGNVLLGCPVCLDDPSPLPPAPMAPFLLPWCFLPSQPSAPPHVGWLSGWAAQHGWGGQSPELSSPSSHWEQMLRGTAPSWRGQGRDGEGGLSGCAPLCSGPTALERAGLPGQGQRDHTKAPTAACAGGLPPRSSSPRSPLGCSTVRGPLKGAFSSLTTLSHRPDSTIREMAFVARPALAALGRPAGR